MDIGSILSRAWQIIWRHKVLWIFGILAGCTSTNYGSSNFRYTMDQGELPPQIQRFFNQIPDWQIATIIGISVLVILLLVIIAIFLGTIGRIGMIRGTLQADQAAERLEFSELFNGSLPYFWRVFLLNLLVGLAFAAIVVVVSVGLVITIVGLVCLIPLICLLVPIGWLVTIITEQASIAIVVENLGILDGLRRGWDVVRNNLGPVIVMGLILILGVGLVGGFIIGLPFAAIVLPALFGVIAGTPTAIRGGLAFAALCLVAYLPVLIVLNGILRGYIESAWTLTFLRLTGRQIGLAPVPSAAE